MFWRRAPQALPAAAQALTPRRDPAPSAELVQPSLALVQQILDEYALAHEFDEDGDLVVRWENCSVFFFVYGERDEVLQARLYLSRRFSADLRGQLVQLVDEWNRTKLFPKAYTVLPDDGLVGLCAEHCQDFDAGVTRQQLTFAVGTWLDTLVRFASWVDEQI